MTDVAATERAALADLFTQVGPDAPTLCDGWRTRDLAAHLVIRERRPAAAAGILLRPFAARTRRTQERVAASDWSHLIDLVRRRPRWSLISNPLLDEAVNRTEFFIHHEDVRRAVDGWQPRPLPDGWAAALWPRARMHARLVLRRVPATVTVAAPGLGITTVGRFARAKPGRGGPAIRLSGDPGELLLFLFGRQAQALVELTGPDEITARMRQARYGI